jgi:integrase
MKRLTFHDAVKAVLAFKTREFSNAKHAKQWERTLVTYAGPTLDAVPVGEIETAHIVKTLEPIWMMKTETASRVRQRIETVLDWCVAAGHMPGPNPARWKGHLDKLLPKATKIKAVKHHRAVPYREVGGLMVKLRERRGLAARALEFAILTAARSGEVRGARWDEIDREARIWTVPARRMKTKVEQRVPLSTEALRLLDQAPRFEGTDLVFPASRGDVLSDMTLVTVLRRMAVDAVPHGFRATFKTWATEQTAYPREVIEAALAHTMGDKTEQAYQRGDLLEKRRALMADWGTYCRSSGEEGRP